ncbi:MAG: hypothetical protein V8Q84_09595 [Bilophila sp.]
MMARLYKLLVAMVLVCGLALPAVAAQTSVPDLTGRHWMQSTLNEKLAFLYGASNVIAVEQVIAQKRGVEPSPFVSGWIKAFGNTNWTKIQKDLDAWYATHPADANRDVFEVLWTQFIVPANK